MATRGKEPVVWAYVAGLVDGEGTAMLNRMGTKPGWNTRYQAMITVVNTSLPVLEWLQAEFGGSLRPRKKQKEHHRQAWAWRLGDQKLVEFCKGIQPYLRIKHRQVALLIEFLENKRRTNYGRGARLSDEEAAWRTEIHSKIIALNDWHRPQRLSEGAPSL